MEQQLMTALSSGDPRQRKSALVQLRTMGEYGASMGYHEQAYESLEDPDPSVQAAAINALANMGNYGADYAGNVAIKLKGATTKDVKKAGLAALGCFGEFASMHADVVEGHLADTDLDLVVEACIALGSMKIVSAASKVAAKLEQNDAEVVIAACIGLGYMDAETDALGKMMDSKEARIRAAALGAMPKDKAEKYASRACKLLADGDVYVRINAMKLISGLGEKAAEHAAEIGAHLQSEEVGVRVAAAAALGALGPAAEAQVEALVGLLGDTGEDSASLMMSVAGVQGRVPATLRKPACAAAAALGALGERASQTAPKVAEVLSGQDFEIKVAAVAALGKMGEAGAKFEDQLIYVLDDPHPLVVAAACTAIGSIARTTNKPSSTAAGKMAELIKHVHPAVRGAALGGLANMGQEAASFLEDFARCLSDNTGYVRAQAIAAVTACGEDGQMFAAEVCRMMFEEGEVRVRLAAVRALPLMGERGAAFATELASLLEDQLPELRTATVRALAAMGGSTLEEFLPFIQQLKTSDPSPEVRAAAQEVVGGETKALEQ